MAMYTHKLSSIQDKWFLNKKSIDGLSKIPFQAGDKVVICKECRTVWLSDSWEMGGNKCPICQNEETVQFKRKNINFHNTQKIHFINKTDTSRMPMMMEILCREVSLSDDSLLYEIVQLLLLIIPYLFYVIVIVGVGLTIFRILYAGTIPFMIDQNSFFEGIKYFYHIFIGTLGYILKEIFTSIKLLINSTIQYICGVKIKYTFNWMGSSFLDVFDKTIRLIKTILDYLLTRF